MSFNKSLGVVAVSVLLFAAESRARTSDFLVKLRGGYLNTEAALRTGSNGTPPSQKFDRGFIGELGIGYFLHNNFAVELSTGYAQVDYFNLAATKSSIGYLPGTASLQFHLPMFNTLFPYVGVGYTYRFFFQEPAKVDIRSAGSIVYQVGFDFLIPRSEWGFNLDFKYIPKLQHDVTENTEVFKNEMKSFSLMAGVVVKF